VLVGIVDHHCHLGVVRPSAVKAADRHDWTVCARLGGDGDGHTSALVDRRQPLRFERIEPPAVVQTIRRSPGRNVPCAT
jgi:hypothetical protein